MIKNFNEQELLDEIERLYRLGRGLAKISSMLKCSHGIVDRHIAKLGIKRSRAEGYQSAVKHREFPGKNTEYWEEKKSREKARRVL